MSSFSIRCSFVVLSLYLLSSVAWSRELLALIIAFTLSIRGSKHAEKHYLPNLLTSHSFRSRCIASTSFYQIFSRCPVSNRWSRLLSYRILKINRSLSITSYRPDSTRRSWSAYTKTLCSWRVIALEKTAPKLTDGGSGALSTRKRSLGLMNLLVLDAAFTDYSYYISL